MLRCACVFALVIVACGGPLEEQPRLEANRNRLTLGVPGIVVGTFEKEVFVGESQSDLLRTQLTLEGPMPVDKSVGRWMRGPKDAIVGAGVQNAQSFAALIELPEEGAPGPYRLRIEHEALDGTITRGEMMIEALAR